MASRSEDDASHGAPAADSAADQEWTPSLIERLPAVCLDRVVWYLAPSDIARFSCTCRDLRSRLPSVRRHLPPRRPRKHVHAWGRPEKENYYDHSATFSISGQTRREVNLDERGPHDGHWCPR
jgi:hypothetical protein